MTNIKKVLCTNPTHIESTPSLAIYPDGGFFCFGCGYSGRATDIGETPPEGERYVEDVIPKIDYIRSLPVMAIRGLGFPADDFGYYLLWPNGNYYLFRKHVSDGDGAKYKGPAGVPRPLLDLRSTYRDHLVICEGEINALSLREAAIRADIVSPGSAGDFYSKKADRHLPIYKQYANILLVADRDGPGAKACIELKTRLLTYTPHVRIKLMDPDANDYLVKYGKKALKAEIEKDLEVLGRLPREQNAVSAPREAIAEARGPARGVYGSNRDLPGSTDSESHTQRREEVSGEPEGTWSW